MSHEIQSSSQPSEHESVVQGIHFYENPAVFDSGSSPLPRFMVQSDPWLKQAYDEVQSRLADATVTLPAVTGAATYGSTVKGYASQERRSDIDLSVFVDADILGLSLRPNLQPSKLSFSPWSAFERPGLIPKQYQESLDAYLADVTLPVSVYCEPLSHDLLRVIAGHDITAAANEARFYELRQAGAGTEVDTLADWATIDTDEDSLSAVPGLAKQLGPELYTDSMSVSFWLKEKAAEEGTEYAQLRAYMFGEHRQFGETAQRLFGVAITPGLAPYRRTFLDTIAQADNPDAAWQHFVRRLAQFEDGPKHPRNVTDINYPQTFTEAIQLYG